MKDYLIDKNPSIINLQYHAMEKKEKNMEVPSRIPTEPVRTEKHLETNFEFEKLKSDNLLKSTHHYMFKSFKPSGACCNKFITNRFPVLDWIPKYNARENLLKDFIGGMTVSLYFVGYTVLN